MSQYIQGIVDYIPQIQPFKPNLNFFQQVLETKEAQYKAGYDRLSSLYGNLLQSPMLRTENIELRNKFFNDISAEISKISSMDLSLNQNVDAASKIFQPLIDNDYIMKDMAYTKQAYSELQKAESFRNCTDEKKCGGKYWEGGVRAVQYQMADFAKSGADESLRFTSPRFTPYVNIPKKAMEFAKEMGFNMQTVTFSPDGRYRIKTKNGEQMIPSLTDAFAASFGNDQSARDYYSTSAYLSRKDFITGNADKYGSEDAAEAYYLNQMSNDLLGKSIQETSRIDNDLKNAKNREEVSNQIIQSAGVNPADSKDQKLISSRNQAIVDQLISNAAKDQQTQTQEVLEPETFQIVDIDSQRSRIDSAVANALFSNDLTRTAQDYAMLTVEQDIEEDRYALASFDHSLAMSRMAAQHGYDLDKMSRQQAHDKEMENIRTANDILVKTYGNGSDGTANGTPNGESLDWMSALGQFFGGEQHAEEVDLEKADYDEFKTQQQKNEEVLHGRSQVLVNVLDSIISAKDGTVIPGTDNIKVTPELRKWATDTKNSTFGKLEEREIEVTSDDWDTDIPWYQWVANIALFEENEYTGKKKAKVKGGGYLDNQGKLINFSENTDFSGGNDNNGYSLARRLDNVSNDPIAQMVLKGALSPRAGGNISDPNASLGDYNIAYKNSEIMYNTYAEGLQNNMNAVNTAALSTQGKNLVAKQTDPDYAYDRLSKIVSPSGYMTKKDFVADYVKNAPANSVMAYNKKTGMPIYMTTDDWEAQADDLYDEYKTVYQDTYNQASGAVDKKVEGYKNLAYGFIESAPGAGVQANSRVYTVDSAFRGDPSALDYKQIMMDLRNNMSGAQVFVGGDPYNLDLDDGAAFNSNENVKQVLDVINSNFISGAKTTDDGRARFSMTVHPLIGGNLDKVGVTIKLNPEFYSKNKGTTNKPGSLNGAPEEFTIVMDGANVKADAYQRLKRGPYQLIMDVSSDGYNMSEYNDYGGNLKVTKNPGGGYNARGTVKGVNENGQIIDLLYDVNSGTSATADQFIPAQYGVLQDLHNKVYAYADSMRKLDPNFTYDPNIGKPE